MGNGFSMNKKGQWKFGWMKKTLKVLHPVIRGAGGGQAEAKLITIPEQATGF